jgi:CRP-like cAMP-binding protein
VFYVQEGSVKVSVVSEQGKEAVVALHGSGDFFGESCLNGHPLCVATAVAIAESVILDARARTAIAVKVVKLARRGECSPTALRDQVLAEVSAGTGAQRGSGVVAT